jgi:predicted DCC family thiol-disulfide oxidoreductase YuxK
MSSNPRALPATVGRDDGVVLFDGLCQLCSGSVRFLLRRDRQARLRFAALQSPAGQTLLEWCRRPPADFDTLVFIERGRAYFKSTAVLRLARYLAWPWPLCSLALVVPECLRNWCYDRLARNRYWLFGRRSTCLVPSPDILQRFLP